MTPDQQLKALIERAQREGRDKGMEAAKMICIANGHLKAAQLIEEFQKRHSETK